MPIYRVKTLIAAALVLLAAVTVVLITIAQRSLPRQTAAELRPWPPAPVILDAGHGGPDGGAVALSGVSEAGLNLAITLRTQGLLEFLGVPARLTRTGEDSLDYSPDMTIRQNKNADLQARLALSEGLPGSPFISIHLNNFRQIRYSGAQVFFGGLNAASRSLAEALQGRLRAVLDPANTREVKPAPEVFLMERITAPAVIVECGFLSNAAEAERLQDPHYQTQIALALTAGYVEYLTG